MIAPEYIRTMAQYNHWMNQKLYAAAAQLTEEQRRADRGAFFKSVRATLAHLIWGDSLWMSRFIDDPSLAVSAETANGLSYEELHARREKLDQDILQWAEEVDVKWLASDKTWTSVMYQKTFTRPVWLLVMQMFNHQTHHRGQVTTLLSQFNIDIGVTDLPMMPMFVNYGE